MVDWTWTNGGIAFCLLFMCVKVLWFLERIAEATERAAGIHSPISMFRSRPDRFPEGPQRQQHVHYAQQSPTQPQLYQTPPGQ